MYEITKAKKTIPVKSENWAFSFLLSLSSFSSINMNAVQFLAQLWSITRVHWSSIATAVPRSNYSVKCKCCKRSYAWFCLNASIARSDLLVSSWKCGQNVGKPERISAQSIGFLTYIFPFTQAFSLGVFIVIFPFSLWIEPLDHGWFLSI